MTQSKHLTHFSHLCSATYRYLIESTGDALATPEWFPSQKCTFVEKHLSRAQNSEKFSSIPSNTIRRLKIQHEIQVKNRMNGN